MLSAFGVFNASILIIDDKEANVLLLERMLRGAGYTAITSTMDPHARCVICIGKIATTSSCLTCRCLQWMGSR